MSTGNQGSQNYDKERSQRVGLQSYIRWACLYAWFLLNVCNMPPSQIFLFIALNKKKKRHCCEFVWM